MAKRKFFVEMMEGVDAMQAHREGRITLRSYRQEPAPQTEVDSPVAPEASEEQPRES